MGYPLPDANELYFPILTTVPMRATPDISPPEPQT